MDTVSAPVLPLSSREPPQMSQPANDIVHLGGQTLCFWFLASALATKTVQMSYVDYIKVSNLRKPQHLREAHQGRAV